LRRTTAEVCYDAAAWTASMLLAAWATQDIPGSPLAGVRTLTGLAVTACALAPAGGLIAGLYRSRHPRGSRAEMLALVLAAVITGTAFALLIQEVTPGQRAPLQTVLGGTAFALLAMLGARHALFTARQRPRRRARPHSLPVIVFGAGAAGTRLVDSLLDHPGPAYRPVALLDDDVAKRRLRIRGVPVAGGRDQMAQVSADTGATVLVIAIARPSGPVVRELAEQAERCGLTPKVVPTVSELISGAARIEGVRDPRITDLLGRSPVRTDIAAVAGRFTGQRILVTGAGGSIGAELCRQLHRLNPASLVMLDRDESALHAIQLALHGRALLDTGDTVLADIRDARRICHVFDQVRPQIVFHAAALKHLPLLEQYPAEALQTNVWGTANVLAAAAQSGVESFVNISTDKAANPVSVLGYSKRLAERLTADMASQAAGTYLSVRFGNVLGSRGSVLTVLTAQVAAGGPVTVTHPDITRYFMTVDEAVQLVLQAAVIGRDGEVLVLDMGEPVRIADVARHLVAAAHQPVDIVYTGLRPGEKLAEDLLGTGELDHRPFHPLIRHVPVRPLPPAQVADLDPASHPASLRAALAAHARSAPAEAAVPAQSSALIPAQPIRP
jgi:FlaA1/EpsC-like NDP-sugar epimerase